MTWKKLFRLKYQYFSCRPSGKIRSFDAFTVEQAAGYFDISERRIRQMLATGVLKGTKNGRSWIIDFPFMVRLGTRGPASKVFRRGSCVPKNAGIVLHSRIRK